MYEFKSEDVFDLCNNLTSDIKQKGDELFFKHCPYCNGGSSNDKNTFSINYKTGSYSCFRSSCGVKGHFVEMARDFNYQLEDYTKKVYRNLPQKQIIVRDKAVQFLKNRGISENIVKKYSITTQKNNENNIAFPFYDENKTLVYVKYRDMTFKKGEQKNKEWCEKNTKPILFGMSQCEDFDTLIITEGQIDSLSISECGFKNAVSVPSGCNNFEWLNHCWDWINKFEKILVFGDLENGKMTLIDRIRKTIKKPILSVRFQDYLYEKDANAILMKYGKKAIIHAVENAEVQAVDFITRLSQVERVNLSTMPKIKTGFPTLDRTIGGLYLGQVILLSGKRGEGKSTFMSQIVAEAIEQNFNCFVYSGELPNFHFKNWLDLQIAGAEHSNVSRNEYGDEVYFINETVSNIINNWYHDKAFLFDNSSINDNEFEGILSVIENAIQRFCCKLICIDNLMTALDDDPKSDVYRQQSMFVKSLKRLAQKHEVAIILIAHPNKATKKEFQNDSVSGSGDITNAVDVVMSYHRNHDETSNHNSELVVTKNRLTGKLIFDKDSVKMIYSQKSKRIMEIGSDIKLYSCFKNGEEIVESNYNLLL